MVADGPFLRVQGFCFCQVFCGCASRAVWAAVLSGGSPRGLHRPGPGHRSPILVTLLVLFYPGFPFVLPSWCISLVWGPAVSCERSGLLEEFGEGFDAFPRSLPSRCRAIRLAVFRGRPRTVPLWACGQYVFSCLVRLTAFAVHRFSWDEAAAELSRVTVAHGRRARRR